MPRKTRLPVQQFRGTASNSANYVGPVGELTVIIDNYHSLTVHDGYTPSGRCAGFPLGSIVFGVSDFSTNRDTGVWYECKGQELDKTTFPELFKILKTRFGGTGDKFNLPTIARTSTGNAELVAYIRIR